MRAVAGMLHYMKALVSADTPSFKQDYSHALEVYRAMHRNSKLGPGSVCLPPVSDAPDDHAKLIRMN